MTANPPPALRQFYDTLVASYGPQRWWPSETAIETVVGAYLTQNTAWRNVERSIANLKEHGVLTIDGLRSVPEEELRALIRPSGYMLRKGAALKAFIALLDARYQGSLDTMASAPGDETREALLALPGVGPETADAILLYALHQPVMVVDEYLRRIVTRHSLIHENARYPDIQRLSLQAFASDSAETLTEHYNEFHALVVEVGKTHCGGVPRCAGCPLNKPAFSPPTVPERAARIPRNAKVSL
jgi:endonuclease-3 related protein